MVSPYPLGSVVKPHTFVLYLVALTGSPAMLLQLLASFSGLPCFYLPFVFTRPAKSGKSLGASITSGECKLDMTSGGCKLDIGSNCQSNALDHPFECSTAVMD